MIEQMDNDVDIPPGLTDRAATYLYKCKRARSPGGRGSGPPSAIDPTVDAEFDPDMVRNASLPTVAVALRSRRAEWLTQRKCEGAAQSCRQRRGVCELTVEALSSSTAVDSDVGRRVHPDVLALRHVSSDRNSRVYKMHILRQQQFRW
jgi:hypothetical protein